MAAEQDDADAMYQLGLIFYNNAEVINKDYALMWFTRAVDLGNESSRKFL